MIPYNSSDYWIERGKSEFIREHNRPLHEQFFYHKYFLDKIDNQLFKFIDTLEFKEVLELGCGWGFMSKKLLDRYYTKITHYCGIDISNDQLNKADIYLKSYGKFMSFNVGINDPLINKSNHYDLVFESTVFIHLSPKEIEDGIKTAFNGCKKFCLSWDWFNPETIGQSYGGYCFNHNYPELYLEAGADVVKVIPIKHPLSFLKDLHIPKVSNYFKYPSALICAYKK